MKEDSVPEIFSVSDFLGVVNHVLKKLSAKVHGEVTSVSKPMSGHVYFTLKDTDGATLDCVCWKYDYMQLGLQLDVGMEVIVSGHADVYPANGRFSFKAKYIELAGQGALKAAYDKLKDKLAKDGLFSGDRKQLLPELPEKIGIITSETGAVIHDFLSNLGSYGFKISFADSRVEGVEAVDDILSALDRLEVLDLDAIVVIRGGGALEAFQAFNNEVVVRRVAACKIPIIAGLGHHEDEPLVALAADYSASTPTAVAEYLNTSWAEVVHEIKHNEIKILGLFSGWLSEHRGVLNLAQRSLREPIKKSGELLSNLERQVEMQTNVLKRRLGDYCQITDTASKKVVREASLMIEKEKVALQKYSQLLEIYDPASQLRRGYSIALHGGKVLKSTKGIKKGDVVDIRLSDGILGSQIIK